MRSTLFRLTIAATLCAIAAPASAKSAGALLLGSPKARVTARSEFLFHGSGAYRPGRSPWDGFVGNDPVSKRMMERSIGNDPASKRIMERSIGNDPASKRIMERSPWGRRIQRHLEATGALETPAYTTLTGAELIARFGVPACPLRVVTR